MDTCFYSFRTNPFLRSLEAQAGSVFTFGRLREDFEIFQKILLLKRPKQVVGIAASWDSNSYIETLAVNRFGKAGCIMRGGPDKIQLDSPKAIENFRVHLQGTHAFCNWAMYKIGHYLIENNLPLRHSFFHCHENDIPVILRILSPPVGQSAQSSD